uniref:Synaptobrevin, longin-like domain protein n=1 Tax=Tanacetum cinerariifolium TaxID=118510 RepID=A0A6L2LBN9_TANCI|nr:hypothetical protein [Tanacetum cinerariifolium]
MREVIQALVDGKKVIVNEASIRRDLRLDDAEGTTCLPNVVISEELARMCAKTTAWNEFSNTIASAIICLANNKKFNFSKYILDNMVKNLEARVKFYMFPRFVQVFMNHQLGDMSHHKGIFINPSLTKKRKHKSRRKQRKETEVPHIESQTEENIPTPSYDLLPSGEHRMQLSELMEIYTKFFDMVLSLEQIKTNQVAEIEKLKKRVKQLEGKRKKRTHRLKRLYKVGLTARVDSSGEEEGLGDQEDASKQGRIAEIDADEDRSLINETAQDQGRMNDEDLFGVNDLNGDEMIVDVTTEPEKPLKKKDQISFDEEVARKLDAQLKAKMEEEERIAREKDKASRALSIEEISKLLAKLIKSRRKYFAAKRAAEIRNKPPIKAQQKIFMCTYMKNMEGYKQNDFKGKSFDAIKKMFDKVYKIVNTFMAMDSEVIEGSKKTQAEVTEGSSKRVKDEIEQESAKRQRLEKEDDSAELERCLEIVPKDDDDITIKATPLSSKSPTIVDYKIYKEAKKSYFKIIKADGNSQNYLTFRTMFKNSTEKT